MRKTFLYLIITIIILLIIVLTWQYVEQSSRNSMKKSIVVLPFSSDSADSTNVVLTPEEEQLLGKPGTDDSVAYNAFPKGFQSYIDSLSGVSCVIEGSIIDKNDSVEIQIQMLDETGDQIWAKTFMSSKNELPEIYNKIQQELEEAEQLRK